MCKEKVCKDCKTSKPLDQFYKLQHAAFGVSNICKICHKERAKINYLKNAEGYKYRAKTWAIDNKEKRKQIISKSDQKHRIKKRERNNTYSKLKRILNPEQERIKGRFYAHIRRMRVKAADCKINPGVIKLLLRIPNGVCVYCGKCSEKLTVDHFIPISKGGKNELVNLVICCKSCNSSKKNSNGYDWILCNNNLEALKRMKVFFSKSLKLLRHHN